MTEIFNAKTQKENGTSYAGRIIRSGGLVAFPTETVYGLGANGLDADAVLKIFEAKGRPADNPLILHIAKRSDLKSLWLHIPEKARALADAYWPGPLTLVYLKSDIVPDVVSAGLKTVAVRMPEHKTALALIRAAGVPIAAPSANLSGKPSPTMADHVISDLNGKVDVIIDGGPCKYGVESTVLSLIGEPTILRPGGITREMIGSVIGEVRVSEAALKPLADGAAAESPGMKYKHYAPNAQVIIADGAPRYAAGLICREYDLAENSGKRCIILATEQTKNYYRGRKYAIIGDREMPSSLCASLFGSLRRYSDEADIIFAEAVPATAQGLAYMNRLLRAAGFCVISH